MKRRFLSILLAALMLLSLLPATALAAGTEGPDAEVVLLDKDGETIATGTLKEILEENGDEQRNTIKLLKDVTYELGRSFEAPTLEIYTGISLYGTMDLNGYTLTIEGENKNTVELNLCAIGCVASAEIKNGTIKIDVTNPADASNPPEFLGIFALNASLTLTDVAVVVPEGSAIEATFSQRAPVGYDWPLTLNNVTVDSSVPLFRDEQVGNAPAASFKITSGSFNNYPTDGDILSQIKTEGATKLEGLVSVGVNENVTVYTSNATTALIVRDGSAYLYDTLQDAVDDAARRNETAPTVYLVKQPAPAVVPAGLDVNLAKVDSSDETFEVDESTQLLTFTGSGTSGDPYIIDGEAGLIALRNAVNAGQPFEGVYFQLADNITLNEENWTPIGNGSRNGRGYDGNSFQGVFDGNGKSISGLKISSTDDDNSSFGLFGVLDGGTVKDINFTGAVLDTASGGGTGAAVGTVVNGGAISGITVDDTSSMTGNKYLGGIVGCILKEGAVSDCENAASVTAMEGASDGYNIGGIVGAAYYDNDGMSITNCTNSGAVSGKTGIGGIVGLSVADISGCTNTGTVTGNGTSVGGIAGEQKVAGSIDGCTNGGNVTNNNTSAYGTGGIVGWVRYPAEAAYTEFEVIEVTNNTNSGTIDGGNDGGGIIGTLYNAGVVTGNENTALSIKGITFAAGIVGNLQFTETPGGGIASHAATITDNVSTTALEKIDAENKDLYVYNNGTTSDDNIGNNSTAFVAQVGEQKYATLSAALDAASTGANKTVTLLANATLANAIPNGVTLQVPANITLMVESVGLSAVLGSQGTLEVQQGGGLTLAGNALVGSGAPLSITAGSAEIIFSTHNITLTSNSAATVNSDLILRFSSALPIAATIEDGATVTVNAKLTVPNNSSLTVNGTLNVADNGILRVGSAAKLNGSGTVNNAGIITLHKGSATSADVSADIALSSGGEVYSELTDNAALESHLSNYSKDTTGGFTVEGVESNGVPVQFSTKYTYYVPSSSSSSGATRYTVSAPSDVEGGAVSVSPSRASRGQTVTVTVTPDEGYELDALTVTDADGNKLTLTDKGDGKYTFTMPRGAVSVAASFKAVEEPRPSGFPFTDVTVGDWYYDAVAYAWENGLMTGTSATTFAPGMTTDRAMMTTLLWRLEGSPVVNYLMDFTDVAEGLWYSEAVRWAASEGVVNGVGDGSAFAPTGAITREQMAVMLYRYAQYKGYDVTGSADLSGYADAASVSGWAQYAMQWAVDAGLISGVGNSTLNPQGSATRAEIATILMRFIETFVPAE